MSKKVVVNALLRHADIRLRDAEALVEVFFGALRDELVQNGLCRLPGIGSLSVVRRAARNGFSPGGEKPYSVPDRWAVRFKASGILVESINTQKPLQAAGAGN